MIACIRPHFLDLGQGETASLGILFFMELAIFFAPIVRILILSFSVTVAEAGVSKGGPDVSFTFTK